MSRKAVLLYLAISGVIYYAVMIGLGFRTLGQAVQIMCDAVWWGGVALGIHWYSRHLRGLT